MPFSTHLFHICNKIPRQHSNSSLLKYRSSHLEVDLRLSYIAICNATLQQICQLDHWRVFSEPFSQSGTGDLLPSFSENHIANVFLGTVPKIHPFWWRHPSLTHCAFLAKKMGSMRRILGTILVAIDQFLQTKSDSNNRSVFSTALSLFWWPEQPILSKNV